MPGVLVIQHFGGSGPCQYFVMGDLFIDPGDAPHSGKDDDQVAGERGDLASGYFGDGYGQVIEIGFLPVLPGIERAGHSTGGKSRLLSGQRCMCLFNKDETDTIIDTIGEAMPENGQFQVWEYIFY